MTFSYTGGERVILREIIKTLVMVRRYAATSHSIMHKLDLQPTDLLTKGTSPSAIWKIWMASKPNCSTPHLKRGLGVIFIIVCNSVKN